VVEIVGVYFIEDTSTGLIKIGCSINMKSRILAMQGENSGLLKLHGYLPASRHELRLLEGLLHKQYQHKRRHGEWFSLMAFPNAIVRDRFVYTINMRLQEIYSEPFYNESLF
jgi:hypothetical protein